MKISMSIYLDKFSLEKIKEKSFSLIVSKEMATYGFYIVKRNGVIYPFSSREDVSKRFRDVFNMPRNSSPRIKAYSASLENATGIEFLGGELVRLSFGEPETKKASMVPSNQECLFG